MRSFLVSLDAVVAGIVPNFRVNPRISDLIDWLDAVAC